MARSRAAVLLRWLLILALLTGVGLAGWYSWLRYSQPEVSITRVVEGPVVQAFYATGTLLPDREYPIRSNNPGYLVEVKVDKGDHISRDQPLAVVREDGVQLRYEQAKADRDQKRELADEKRSPILAEYDARIESAKELLEIARRQQKRLSDAVEHSAAAQSDLDQALDRVRTLAGEIETLKAQRAAKQIDLQKDLKVAAAALEIAQWNLDRQTIRCPIDHASVLTRPLPVGTRVAVNDQIMSVADVRPDQLIMRAQVDEEDITKVKLGSEVRLTLYAYDQREFKGVVKKIYDKADPDRRTFEVDVAMVDKDPAFAAGMTGELAFIMEQKDGARIVPSQAVQGGDIFTVRDGRIRRVDAKLGLKSVERTEVLEGLEVGDVVVISPVLKLSEGQRVRTVSVDPVQAALANRPKQQEVFKGGF